MDLQLTNKRALVTGSTAGIGFAIASLLTQEGASVVVNGRSRGRVEEAVRHIRRGRQDAQVTGVAADLGTKEGVDELTRSVPALDILVNNSSESGLNIPAEIIHYGVTKTAQIALARGLAETTTGTNVTVNSVLPGLTRSEGVEQFVQDLAKGQGTDAARVEAEFFRTARPSSLLRRFATPEEVAAMVVYVCSPRASATNGAALRVDGGVVRFIV
jgi:NAD(P)-dependent dehydrogenase (short-subunit alcohol dehydrogenase family)